MPNSDVVIVGAGPYGLSIAAHLRHSGIDFRIFGMPMENWRSAMPAGMFLKSDGAGTNLSDPANAETLAKHYSSDGLHYSDHGMPVPLDTFVSYGLCFQRKLVPHVEPCRVVRLGGKPGRFEMQLDTGEMLTARRVVLAVGTTYFGYLPRQFSTLPRELVTHSRDHTDLGKFAQREVIVVGGGQSALETAALLNESGAMVRVIVRASRIAWNPLPAPAAGQRQLFKPQTALGLGWKTWFYCHGQGIFQYLPFQLRSIAVKHVLGPAGAWWLKERVVGRFPILCDSEIGRPREKGGRLQLSVRQATGRAHEITADHLIAATGYRVNLDSLTFLDPNLASELRREGTAPALSYDFESSVAGLYFTGLAAATHFGPSMRFVFGARFAAGRIANALNRQVPATSKSGKPSSTEYCPIPKPQLLRPTSPPRKRLAAANFDTSAAVLVLNLGEYPFHQASLGIIRSLGSVGIPVFAVQRSVLIPSGVSQYVSGKFLWKTDGKNKDHFLEGIAAIAKILDRQMILLPTDDLSAILIAENREVLSAWSTFAQMPAALPRRVANKRNLYELCQHLGVACPPTLFPNSREEWVDFAKRTPLPVVVKVIEPWLAPKGVKPTLIISDRQELIDYCDSHGQIPAAALMIQEMIPSATSEDWFVHGYCDNCARPSAIFTGVKLRSYPPFAGPTTLARSVRNDALRQQASELFAAIGYQGIMDLDYRLDRRDGRYHLLDFNPRIGAQFRLFRDAEGMDVARALHLDLTGRTVKVGPQIEGRTFLAEVQDLLTSSAYWRSGALSLKDWYSSLRKIDEPAWYTADDPLPFLLMCLHMPFRAVSRALDLKIGH